MGLFSRTPRDIKAVQTELDGLRMMCKINPQMPEANQRHAAQVAPRDLAAVVARAAGAGHASEVTALLSDARNRPPAQLGGVDWDGILDAGFAELPT